MHFISLANTIGAQAGSKTGLRAREQGENAGFDAVLAMIGALPGGEDQESPAGAENPQAPLVLPLLPVPQTLLAGTGKTLPPAGNPATIVPQANPAPHQPSLLPIQPAAASTPAAQADGPQPEAGPSLTNIAPSPLPRQAGPAVQVALTPVPSAEPKPAAGDNRTMPALVGAASPVASATLDQLTTEGIRQSGQPVAANGGEPGPLPQEIAPARKPRTAEWKAGASFEQEAPNLAESAQRSTGPAVSGLVGSGSEQPVRSAVAGGPLTSQPSGLEADLEQIVDRLSAARLSARAEKSSMALPHPDFGRVTLDFTAERGDRLRVEMPDAPAELRQAFAQQFGAQQNRTDQQATRSDAPVRDFANGPAGEDSGQRRESGQAQSERQSEYQSERRPDRQDARHAHAGRRTEIGTTATPEMQPAGPHGGTWA